MQALSRNRGDAFIYEVSVSVSEIPLQCRCNIICMVHRMWQSEVELSEDYSISSDAP